MAVPIASIEGDLFATIASRCSSQITLRKLIVVTEDEYFNEHKGVVYLQGQDPWPGTFVGLGSPSSGGLNPDAQQAVYHQAASGVDAPTSGSSTRDTDAS